MRNNETYRVGSLVYLHTYPEMPRLVVDIKLKQGKPLYQLEAGKQSSWHHAEDIIHQPTFINPKNQGKNESF
jgi:hypothetical protein